MSGYYLPLSQGWQLKQAWTNGAFVSPGVPRRTSGDTTHRENDTSKQVCELPIHR